MKWTTLLALIACMTIFCTEIIAEDRVTQQDLSEAMYEMESNTMAMLTDGKENEAEDAWIIFLQKVEKEAGKDTVIYANCLSKLAQTKFEQFEQDNRVEATEVMEQALQHHKAAVGENNINYIFLLRQASSYLKFQKKYTLAEEKSRQALTIIEEVAGKDDFLHNIITKEIEEISFAASGQEKWSKLKAYFEKYAERGHKIPEAQPDNKKYSFILMVRDDPQVLENAGIVLDILIKQEYEPDQVEKVSSDDRLHTADRQDGNSYLSFDSSLPYEVIERVLDALVPYMEPSPTVRMMNMVKDDYFLIWML